jgi:hypothetical protein
MKSFVLITALTLSGCATCREYPVTCAVASAVVVGSIAVAVEHRHDQQFNRAITANRGPECINGGCPQ